MKKRIKLCNVIGHLLMRAQVRLLVAIGVGGSRSTTLLRVVCIEDDDLYRLVGRYAKELGKHGH